MGERLLCKQEVVGSIPITSTTERAKLVSGCGSGALAPREHQRVGGLGRPGAASVGRPARGSRDRSGKESLPMGELVGVLIFDRVKRE